MKSILSSIQSEYSKLYKEAQDLRAENEEFWSELPLVNVCESERREFVNKWVACQEALRDVESKLSTLRSAYREIARLCGAPEEIEIV